ncbi:MAG: glycosyltransferase family 2 protein [Pseudomonadota bacterium]
MDGVHQIGPESSKHDFGALRIAVILPCYNEEHAIGQVVADFREALPTAEIYVYDNNSTDRTVDVAHEAGAIVRTEPRQGKGNVVRRMFSDVDADIFVLADGDDTYEAGAAPELIRKLLDHQLDMVTGRRVAIDAEKAYRRGHRFGNRALTGLVQLFFGVGTQDMLSGYRVMSRRFVKSFPALSLGFEIETELTVHALELRMPIADHPTAYKERPPGSVSKLSTIKDGMRIGFTIIRMLKAERPLMFFSSIASALALLSLVLIAPVFWEYLQTGLVPRFPTAILSGFLMLAAIVSVAAGLILDSVTLGRRELKRLSYLNLPATSRHRSQLGARVGETV